LGNAVGRIVSLNFDTPVDRVDIRAFLAISEIGSFRTVASFLQCVKGKQHAGIRFCAQTW